MKKQKIIYYSPLICLIQAVAGLLLLGVGVFIGVLMFRDPESRIKDYAFCIIFTFSGLYIIYYGMSKFFNDTPQIILSEEGIETFSTKLQKWEDIKNERAITLRSGKHSSSFLIYDYPNGSAKLSIGMYDTNEKSLNKWLVYYREQSKMRD